MAERFALIIGNSQYEDSRLGRLKAPDVDVRELESVLRSPDIGQFTEVMALRDESCAVVRKAVARFYDQRKRDDLLFLYFSGHGVKDEQGHLYLALRDTEVGLLAGTAIETSFISDRMDRSFSKRQVLVLDCCHSGAFAHGTKSAQGVSVGTAHAFEGTGLGRVILTATDATQYAWDGDHLEGEPQNSVFTRHLIEGLKSGAADQDADGVVTVDELYDYVHEQVVNTTPRQTPYKWSYRQQGEIVLAHNPFIKSDTLPPALRDAVAGTSALVRLDAVRDLQMLLRGQDVGQSRAALAALKVLTQDDSRKVATAAIEALRVHESEHHEQQVVPPAPPTTQDDPPPASLPLEPPVEDRSGGRPSDVFISYAREDQETAKALANLLSAKGWRIWWDRKIAPGESFDKAIERQLKTCKCAIVLWSTHSVDATWVRNEARRAARRSVLLPILIEAVEPPLEFDDLQAVDLISWKVPAEHPEFEALFNKIQELAGVPVDTRARIAVERARGEFAAGRRNAAIASLAEFRPAHAQVTRALDDLRREAANIARQQAEAARRAQEAAERQRALAAEQARIDDLLERGELGAADRALTTAGREFGLSEFTLLRTRWDSLAAQSAEDERARSTIEAARREFAAGAHQAAIASLAGFRPVHDLVVEALSELREEAAHIARERAEAQAEADRVAREQAEAAQRAEHAAQKQHALADAPAHSDELLGLGQLDAAEQALDEAERELGQAALLPRRERSMRDEGIEGVVVPDRAPRLFPTRFAAAAAVVVVVAVSVWLVRQPATSGDPAVIQPGDSITPSSSEPSAIEEPAVTSAPPAPVVVETAAIEPPARTPPVPDRSPQPPRVDEQTGAKRREELRQAADAAQRAREAEQAQEAKRLQDQKLAAESQAAKEAAEAQQAQEARRLQEQKLAAEAQAAKKAAEAQQAQEAKRLQEQKLAAEAQAAKKAAEAQQAQEARRLQEQKLAAEAQAAKKAADAQAARFFEAIRGDWVHEEDQRTQQTRTQTQELLAMDASCSGTLTRTVTSYERGFAGWKRVDSQTTRLAIRCDAAGRVSGELNARLSMDGATLMLGTSRFVRR